MAGWSHECGNIYVHGWGGVVENPYLHGNLTKKKSHKLLKTQIF